MKEEETTIAIRLSEMRLIYKLIFLVAGGAVFFILFPFLLKYGRLMYIAYFLVLIVFAVIFRMVAGKKSFKITIWLWASGSIIYLLIAIFLIFKGVQPLPYVKMNQLELILYYLSYPLRVLGIFFTGLVFVAITSPIEFLKFGKLGLGIALIYRAFEYSISSFEENRIALMIQGSWPDFADSDSRIRLFFKLIRSTPLLIATTFRNIILWSPWAWICYNAIKKDIIRRMKDESIFNSNAGRSRSSSNNSH
ncbi:MAG: hypothetical protein DRP84_05375 [Spirochaetes bacterium]|nr:MAG: hypothetical protein DRP84_05375 [Spirochaetota bacterium]RKX99866.1 MAG: hypothetical protein DRP55_06610 [Spirochaetota bacterium]